MKKLSEYLLPNLALVQVFTWIALYGLWVLYITAKWNDWRYGIFSGLISFLFYAAATYINFYWLIPCVLRRYGWKQYMVLGSGFLVASVSLRTFVENAVLLPLHGSFYDLGIPQLSLALITNILAFVFGALLRLTIDYIRLQQRQKDLLARQTITKLNLLKAQVQPHFLFNTLNNIYYLTLSEPDKAPQAIAQLSDLMRYFTDEAHKDQVPLSTEIQLLSNYIALEQIRMPHSLRVRFNSNAADDTVLIPPMLLMPLVENIYKHGIDKTSTREDVIISLQKEGRHIVFSTANRLIQAPSQQASKKGLQNLRERLELLYGKNYTLAAHIQHNQFHVLLQIPLR